MARKSRKNPPVAVDTTPEQTIYNAAAYVRLSRDDAKRGDSLETQRRIIENFIAASSDIRLVEVYSDKQITGTRFERPSFQRMLADVEAGRINCIVVKDLSRFGRNAIDSGYYIEKLLPSMGVRFISVTDSFDSLEGDGGILLPLKNVIAESYALDIGRKSSAVHQQNIRDGQFVGRLAPYGYAKDPQDCHHLIVDEEAASIVRRIFDWAGNGKTPGEIVRALNEAEILSPSHYKRAKGLSCGNRSVDSSPCWRVQRVKKMLRDRRYVGDMVQGQTRTTNHKKVEISRDAWVCVPGTHEAIVSRDLFDHVQALLQQAAETRIREGSTPFSPHVLKGKVFCAHCGHPMRRERQDRVGVYRYRCVSRWRFHKGACVQVSVKEEELKAEVLALLAKHTEVIHGGYARAERKDADQELNAIHARIATRGHFLKSLYENLLGGVITAEEFSTMKAAYEEEIAELTARADEIRAEQWERASKAKVHQDFADASSTALATRELTTELVERLVKEIRISHDKSFEIVLLFRDEFGEFEGPEEVELVV